MFRKFKVVTASIISLTFILFYQNIFSKQLSNSSSEITQSLNKLKVLGSVLYLAAHPDDENTAVLTYMSKGVLAKTAYLSLTRGDGGQNLLGSEKADLLGIIRTQELLSARKLDGGQQFFSRAIDFGYSKTAKETLNNWDRELILSDIVKVIREFQPDIILTRFSKTQGGHGHHLSSAILAEEAFYAAADSNKFTEQLSNLKVWKTKRLYWNTWRPSSRALSIDIGEYNSVIGKSYSEISALSRSMHKSQGFGVASSRGSKLVYFDFIAGDSAKTNLFDGIDFSWNRVEGGAKIKNEIDLIINKFEANKPELIILDLVSVYKKLENLEGNWVEKKKDEIKDIIKMCSGLWTEAIVWEPELSLGEEIDVRTMIVNRSNYPIILEKIITTYSNNDSTLNKNLEPNKTFSRKQKSTIPIDTEYTQPYWLKQKHNGKMFTIEDKSLIGLAENRSVITSKFFIKIDGQSFIYEEPVKYRWTDAVIGELFRSVIIRPELSLSVDKSTYVFTNNKSRKINVTIETKVENAQGEIYLDIPKGWMCEPKSIEFSLEDKGDKLSFVFNLSANKNALNEKLIVKAEMNGKVYTDEIVEINYPHIPTQIVHRPTEASLVKLNINIEPKNIGYIMGSGDEIPFSLSQLGYKIDLLSDSDLDNKDLSFYDVIICGVRAFNTRMELGRQQKRIIDFVNNGGTWIVQHNTRFGKQIKQIGPYKYTASGRDRIAEENAKLEILIPDHQLFNFPNKITQKDFEGWVQERGLYFAEKWEGKLYPLLAGNDIGETSKLGGLLFANHGKGVFIFSAYSWFRQLPAGVTGAYRLFVNMISAKGENEK